MFFYVNQQLHPRRIKKQEFTFNWNARSQVHITCQKRFLDRYASTLGSWRIELFSNFHFSSIVKRPKEFFLKIIHKWWKYLKPSLLTNHPDDLYKLATARITTRRDKINVQEWNLPSSHRPVLLTYSKLHKQTLKSIEKHCNTDTNRFAQN